jgi:hypothetical protein
MSTVDFFVNCKVCKRKVDSFSQNTRFIITKDEAIQEQETIEASCGCAIDFPDWQINTVTGLCQIYNFAGTLYLEFYDVEMILEEDE